jgi:hypothetical protein
MPTERFGTTAVRRCPPRAAKRSERRAWKQPLALTVSDGAPSSCVPLAAFRCHFTKSTMKSTMRMTVGAQVLIGDAVEYLRTTTERFDVIICDFPDAFPASREVLQLYSQVLAPLGERPRRPKPPAGAPECWSTVPPRVPSFSHSVVRRAVVLRIARYLSRHSFALLAPTFARFSAVPTFFIPGWQPSARSSFDGVAACSRSTRRLRRP